MGLFDSIFGGGKPNTNKMKKKRDIDGLIRAALQHEDLSVRRDAASALGEIKDEKAINLLINFLGHNDKNVRKRAVRILGEIKDEKALRSLTNALEDKNKYVRKEAIKAVNKLGWQPKTDVEKAIFYIAQGDFSNVSSLGESAIQPLIDILGSNSKNLRKEAIKALLKIREREAVQRSVIDALKNKDEKVRDGAILVLNNFDTKEAQEAIKVYKELDFKKRGRKHISLSKGMWDELASDKNLTCDHCGKKPLLKKGDIIPIGTYGLSGGFTPETMYTKWKGKSYSLEELQKILDQTTYDRAVECTSCGKVICVGCVDKYGISTSIGKGCPDCGSKLENLI